MSCTDLAERAAGPLHAGDRASREDPYLRSAFLFDTGAERYHWLNESLFVGRGHLVGSADLEYQIYRVT
jgi:Protein of unknown function (DUF3237)